MDSKAIIDIGTNTINLLIARMQGQDLVMQHFSRIPARMGEGSMQTGLLTDEAMHRGLHALCEHEDVCADHGVTDIKVTATSALRTARNKDEFLDIVKDELGLDIEVISGDREAELIWKGVCQTRLLDDEVGLVMDIGGGSTEFILGDAKRMIWKKSYPLGVTRLKERFECGDPFTVEEETQMQAALGEELTELWAQCAPYKSLKLIGASGSFNSIDLMLALGDLESLPDVSHHLDTAAYQALSRKLRRSTSDQRRLIPGLVPDRVDTIGYSALLIDLVAERLELSGIWRSTYALKEGLLAELFA